MPAHLILSLFSFYFQSGEFSGSTSSPLLPILGSAIGAFISGSVAIYVFTQGARLQRKQEKLKEEKAITDRTSFVTVLLNSAIKNIAIQVSAVEQYMQATKADPYIISPYREALHLDLQSLLALERADVLKAFEKKGIKHSDYIAFYRNLEFANRSFLRLKSSSETKTADIKEFANQAVQARKKILNDITVYLHNRRFILNNHHGDALYECLDKAVGDYYGVKNKVPSLKYDLENFTRPLSTELLTHRSGPDSIFVHDILLALRDIRDLITTVVNVNESTAVEYATQVNELKNVAMKELKALAGLYFPMSTETTLVVPSVPPSEPMSLQTTTSTVTASLPVEASATPE